jgi:hypothetical protein
VEDAPVQGTYAAAEREGHRKEVPRTNAPARITLWKSYTGMLVSIVILIIFSPYIDRTYSGLIFMDILFGIVIFLGFNAVLKERWKILFGIAVLFIGLFFDLMSMNGTSSVKIVFSSAMELVFLGFITVVMLSHIINAEHITVNEISGALCVYFLMGIMWALIYYMIEFTWPGSYSSLPHLSIPGEINFDTAMSIFSTLLYFSYITLTSVGYGDCAPLTIMSRGFSNIEAVIGQLYIAIIVSRLVGLFIMNRRARYQTTCGVVSATEIVSIENATAETVSTDASRRVSYSTSSIDIEVSAPAVEYTADGPAVYAPPSTPVAEKSGADNKDTVTAAGKVSKRPSLKDFLRRPASWLFISLMTYLSFYPLLIKETDTPFVYMKLIFFVIIVSGLFLMKKNRLVFVVMAVLVGAIIVTDTWLFHGNVMSLLLPVAAVRLFVLVLIICATFSTLIHKEEVTHEHITAAASIYILLGCLWAEIYVLIEICSHGSFLFNGVPWHSYSSLISLERLKMDLFFFSFTTLTTVGYGDTVPLSHVGRLWTYLEAIAGVIYLAVLLGYLVAARVSQMEK